MSDVWTLRVWLAAPLQSWGSSSRFEVRATELVPTKSGVIGLVCCALGRSRDDSVDDLADMRFGVSVEQSGSVLRDYHTAGAGTDPVALAGGGRGRGIVTERYYLQDAAFVAGLECEDRGAVEGLRDALLDPRWPLFLGRRSCPPAGPVVDGDAVFPGGLEAALEEVWRPRGIGHRYRRAAMVHAVVESVAGPIATDDQPFGAAYADRTFTTRRSRAIDIRRRTA